MRGKRRIDKLKTPRRGEPLLVACPTCPAQPRERCYGRLSIGGRAVWTDPPIPTPHVERQAAANAFVEQGASRRFA